MIVPYVNPYRMGGWATNNGRLIPPVRSMAGFGSIALLVPALDAVLEKYFPTDDATVRDEVKADVAAACLAAQPPPVSVAPLVMIAGLAGMALGAGLVLASKKR